MSRSTGSSDATNPSTGLPPDATSLVGVGASAGGIPALREFFHDIPADSGIVFVVVIHLAPEYESNLAEVLQPHVGMPVHKVETRVRMEPNQVYVIPPNRSLGVEDGDLVLAEFANDRERHASIDFLFRTIAETHPDGIGVLLSGTGSDGALGMRAIKEHGGVILAQSPDDAEYPDMPRNVIRTGLVDFVLPARRLGTKVVELRTATTLWPLRDADEPITGTDAEILSNILGQLVVQTSHDFSGYKKNTLLRRIGRRMRVLQVEDLSVYAELLRRSETESQALLQDLLISVTSFFRDPAVFALIEREVIPALLETADEGGTVRVWVPGCATGEEAYSIAMLLDEQANAMRVHPTVQIFGTDLDDDAIAKARDGLFTAGAAADLGETRIDRFFRREGSFLRVRKELREMILFTRHNVLQDPPFSHVDMISCRNLMIYLDRDVQERVLDVFHYALRDDGYLVLGSSENVDGAPARFRAVDRLHRIYQRKPSPNRFRDRFPAMPPTLPPRRTHRDYRAAEPRGTAASDLDLHRAALEAHSPPSILVDHDGVILHVSPSANRYLLFPSGSPSVNVMKAARPELRLELRTALFQAFQKSRPSRSRTTELVVDGERHMVQMQVRPVFPDPGSELALVLFLEHDGTQTDEINADPINPGAQRFADVEEELVSLRDRLQHTVEEADTREEELRAANEELQSINEEYKSTLEELETSREELQSMNEELKTVNDELKAKVDELSRSNDDLSNLMAATDVATLFLDRRLHIKRFTPALRRIFNVMPVDEGRPLSDFTHRLDYPTFREDCARVLETLQPREREASTSDGLALLVRIVPYRTEEDRIAGVVATFADITIIRQAEEQLRRTEERHRLLVEGVREYAIFMIDTEGLVTMWNPGAERIFGYSEEEILGHAAEVLFTPEDRAAHALEAEMVTARETGQALDERWLMRRDGQRFWASGTLNAIHDRPGELRGFAKLLRDNTAQREYDDALLQSQASLRSLTETLESRVAARTSELASAHDNVRKLASDLLLAEQRVRLDIARHLHDDLQQHLYGVQMRIASLRVRWSKQADAAMLKDLSELEQWLNDAVQTTRQLAIDLSPPVLRGEGLVEALGWLGDQMKSMHGLDVEIRNHGVDAVESEDLRVLLFQTVRELLFNIVKHADDKHATIDVRRVDSRIIVEVADGGPGFIAGDALAGGNQSGFGLANAIERLRLFGGDMRIDTAPGRDTHVTVIAPENDGDDTPDDVGATQRE